MEFEYWQLLLFPAFFALGWAAARIDIRHLVKESRSLPRSYFQGLNFLLNEQPDRAIESFVEAVKVDPQTVELHFALGGLFRRRGETERAIRMHQNLIERDHAGEIAVFVDAERQVAVGGAEFIEQLIHAGAIGNVLGFLQEAGEGQTGGDSGFGERGEG